MEEWFKEKKDMEASLQEISELFGDVDESVRNKLPYIFAENFLEEIKQSKEFFLAAAEHERFKGKVVRINDVLEYLSELCKKIKLSIEFKSTEKYGGLLGRMINNLSSIERRAQVLGKALGSFFSSIEYWLCSEGLGYDLQRNSSIEEYISRVYYNINTALNSINITKRHKFIVKRLDTIYKKHYDHLTDIQKQLFEEVIDAFSN